MELERDDTGGQGRRLHSVEEVADLLGLHVKTVRGYVRAGKLKAVRIGKQYRIAHEDLEAFTGGAIGPPARETVRRHREVEVSAIVRIDALDPAAMMRISNTLVAAAGSRGGGEWLRIQTVYDEERATMKIMVFGVPSLTADVLRLIDTLLEERP